MAELTLTFFTHKSSFNNLVSYIIQSPIFNETIMVTFSHLNNNKGFDS